MPAFYFFRFNPFKDALLGNRDKKSPMSKMFFSGYKKSFEHLPDTRIPRVKKIKSGALKSATVL